MKRKFGWAIALGIQILATLAASVLTALSYYLGSVPHGILFWGIMPLIGAASAYLAVAAGLNNYLGWIAPPAMDFLGHYLVWGYAPGAGAVLLCALLSLIGAAAGEVVKRQNRPRNSKTTQTKEFIKHGKGSHTDL